MTACNVGRNDEKMSQRREREMNPLIRFGIAALLALVELLQPLSIGAPQASPQTAEEPRVQTVYVTRTGKRYHREGCRHLVKSKLPITLREAKQYHYIPCKICHPPQ
jgi:hypothetical protein